MAFDEIQFPPYISWGAIVGPEFNTDVAEMSSGYEQRNANWSLGRFTANVATGLKTDTDVQALIAFFNNRQGRARGFRFKDWSDFQVTGGAIATSDGKTASYQLYKYYNDGVLNYARPIYKPVSASLVLYLNGTSIASGWSLNTVTGLLSFTGLNGPITITSITESGTTATLTAAAAHGLVAGSTFTIAGSSVSGYDHTYTALSSGLTSDVVEFTAAASLGSATGGTLTGLAPVSGVVITADFQFDTPVRFDTDKLGVTMETYDTNIWRDIRVIELKLNSSGDG